MPKGLFAAFAVFVSISSLSVASRAQAPAPTSTSGEYAVPPLRIPDGSRPTRYQLTLTVIPGEAKAPGEIVIDWNWIAVARPIAADSIARYAGA